MKTIRQIALLFVAATFLCGLTACNDDPTDNEVISEQSLLRCYALVIDTQNNTETICTPITYKLTLNWTNMAAVVDITGLSAGGNNYPMLSLSSVSWGAGTDGWSSISAALPVVTTTSGMPVTVSDFKLRWLDRLDFAAYAGAYDPGAEFSFTLDKRYKVVGSRNPILLVGKTVSSDGTEEYTSTCSCYMTELDFDKKVAKLSIYRANFAASMPEMTMVFDEIPFTISQNGVITLSKDNLIPSIANTPQPMFPISDLTGTIIPGSGMNLTFKCYFRQTTMYTVNATLNYTDYSDVINK